MCLTSKSPKGGSGTIVDRLTRSHSLPHRVNETMSGASKEANKEVAKDSSAPVGTRVQAAGDALSDKLDETGHKASAEANKQNI